MFDPYLHLGGQILMSKGLSRRRHVDDVVDGTHPGLMSWAAPLFAVFVGERRVQEPVLVPGLASLVRSALSFVPAEPAEARSAKGARGRAGGRWRSRSRSDLGTNVSISIEPGS